MARSLSHLAVEADLAAQRHETRVDGAVGSGGSIDAGYQRREITILARAVG